MRALLWFVLVMMPVSFEAQTREPLAPPPRTTPQQPSPLKAQQVRATIEGCISGTRLIPSLTSNRPLDEVLLNASEFVLDGPRELMTQLRSNHDTHLERVTGIATIPQPDGTTVETYGGTKGKTRVTSGVRVSGTSRQGAPALAGDAPLPVKLRVQSVEHLADKCSPQR